MNILIMNWRDIFHPFSGGAEKITLKYAKYWISCGHTVYWMSNIYPGHEKNIYSDGIKYIRTGPSLIGSIGYMCMHAPGYFLKSIFKAKKIIKSQKIDVVIDEIHGFPFFTPLIFKGRVVLLVCEVAGQIWNKMYPFPINKIGNFLEKITYQIYKKREIWAISTTTANEIKSFLPKTPIKLLPLGIDEPPKIKITKNDKLTFIFLARLVKMKGVEVALKIVEKVKHEIPDIHLYVVGKGSPDYVLKLKKITKRLQIEENVTFVGPVNETEKFEYLSKSHFLIHPSFKEGFGLTVLEASSVGTPAIVRAGGSLEELIIPEKTGILFKNEYKKFNIPDIKSQKYINMCQNAKQFSKKYFWKNILISSQKITKL